LQDKKKTIFLKKIPKKKREKNENPRGGPNYKLDLKKKIKIQGVAQTKN
jgi:hypothetical protein